MADKPSFDQAFPEINRIVQSRRGAWTYTSVVEWQDISQKLLIRVFKKWPQFDPAKGPLEHWVNRLITNALLNEKRDEGGRLARPCIGGGRANGKSCVYNTGGDTCCYTKSGKQCEECPLYAEWAKVRQPQFHVKSTVALENHSQEVSNRPSDYCDYDGLKARLDERMRKELTAWEYHIYTAVYVRHLSPSEVSAELEARVKKWKRAPRADEQFGYQFILAKQRWFKELMIDICRGGHLDT